MRQKDYYGILGIAGDASEEEIKKAYRRQALAYHPDMNRGDTEAEDRFKEISEAYDVLSDRDKRRRYDLTRHVRIGPFSQDPSSSGKVFGWFERNPFGGDFCLKRGRRRGGGCGRRRSYHYSSLEEMNVGQTDGSVGSFPLTFLEALLGTEREVLVREGPDLRRFRIKTPPGLEEGALLRIRGGGLSGSEKPLYLRVRIVA